MKKYLIASIIIILIALCAGGYNLFGSEPTWELTMVPENTEPPNPLISYIAGYDVPWSTIYLNTKKEKVLIGSLPSCGLEGNLNYVDQTKEFSNKKIKGVLCWWAGGGDEVFAVRKFNKIDIYHLEIGEYAPTDPNPNPYNLSIIKSL